MVKMRVTDKVRCKVNEGMFGLFFEDINYALDGGLHAEMIENRSFEFFDCGGSKYNWYKRFDFGYGWMARNGAKIKVEADKPLNRVNPHYLRFEAPETGALVANKAYDGLALTKGKEYLLSFYARADKPAKITAECRRGINSEAVGFAGFTVDSTDWKKYEAKITALSNVDGGCFCLVAEEPCVVYFDFVSLKPADAVYGVFRRDLADALKELKPGFLRFPGGCIVEGNNLDNMYKWKLSVGEPEQRKANWNRWAVHNNNGHGPFSHYNQTLGVGYFEYFELCEYIGAKPLPVCNVGMACQYEAIERFEIEDEIFKCFVQDALDLIEFANGDETTKWGALRAQMGHKEPFGLELLGIGNEQWETPESRFFERYTIFEKAIHEKYPDIKLIGSAGPDVTSNHYTDAWGFYRKEAVNNSNFAYAIDEHYYVSPEWMLENNGFYDDYPRNIGVFAGEYAAHSGEFTTEPNRNNIEAALAEAAFMTGLERNADVVKLASYAPLLARKGYTQWAPDLIWFDERTVCRTPSYFVQKFFSLYTGDEELVVEGLDELRSNGVFASASRDTASGKIFIKLVNTTGTGDLKVPVEIEGLEGLGKAKVTAHRISGNPKAYNSPDNISNICEESFESEFDGSGLLEGYSVTVLEI
ncbi:MAG: carbohydrate binding domain-containing protein [Lachnospiraceae bacterium]|nr:carbohydrate binding domain-containing protein [Lachnospiraceae bacterium]